MDYTSNYACSPHSQYYPQFTQAAVPYPPLSNIQLLSRDEIYGGIGGGKRERPGTMPQNDPLTKKPSPFSPECSIPLPFQLGEDCYGPTAIWKRNERERHRVRCVNEGYDRLRKHLPNNDKERRLSKVETLRLAIRYIQHLEMMLTDEHHLDICQCQLVPPNNAEDASD